MDERKANVTNFELGENGIAVCQLTIPTHTARVTLTVSVTFNETLFDTKHIQKYIS